MMKRLLQSFFGPRVPDTAPGVGRWRYVLPMILFIIAAALLFASYTEPYWGMTLYAPQYPKGLHVEAYLNRLEGDVKEIDLLNHYIGMRPLEEAAQLERSTSMLLVLVMATLIAAAVVVHSRWAALLAVPAVLFPAGFLLDLHLWMDHFGQNLDPKAPLSSAIKPFTPPILGEGVIGNFRTIAEVNTGWWMAVIASAVVIVGLFFHRRAFKPLIDSQRQKSSPQRRREHREERFGESDTTIADHRSVRRLAQHHSVALLCVLCASVVNPARAEARNFDLQAAINAANEGDVILIPAGVHRGPFLVDRPMTLEGESTLAILDGAGEGDVVHITAQGVTILGLTIRNSGSNLERQNTGIKVAAHDVVIKNNIIEDALYGISLHGSQRGLVQGNTIRGKDLHIARRGDAIRLWNSHDSRIVNNTVIDSRDIVMWYSDRVHLIGNHVSNSRYGLHFMYSHDNVLEDNILTENSVGAFLMYSRNLTLRKNTFARNRGPSGYGLGVKDMQGMVIEDNLIVGNRVGAYLDNPPVFLPEMDRFTRNVFAYNDVGIAFQPSVRRVAVFENSFIENHQQVAIWGGGEMRGNEFTGIPALRAGSETAHKRVGNYWSDYRGFDASGNGIGELPYQAESLWDNLMDREPGLRLFLFSPAQQAIEMAAKAFPVVKPRPLFVDDAPLMRPVRADVDVETRSNAGAMSLVAIALLSAAGFALAGAKPQAAGVKGN